MPCNDGGYANQYVQTLQNAQAALCGITKVLDQQNFLNKILDAVDWQEAGISRTDFQVWFEQHKEQDAARRRRQHEEQRRAQLIQQAQSKLTPEEIRALKGYK
jgi:folylpolyglutamate synthase/dihydropteroate synthase